MIDGEGLVKSELGYHRTKRQEMQREIQEHLQVSQENQRWPHLFAFFDQLEALDTHPPPPTTHHLQLPATVSTTPAVTQLSNTPTVQAVVSQVSTVPSMSMNPLITVSQSQSRANVAPISVNPTWVAMPMSVPPNHQHFLHPNMSGSILSGSTSSDLEPPERKRKWKDSFGFGRMMKEVIDKQEEQQMKFLDTFAKQERERMIREEARMAQEIAKMKREHDLLVQERSIAAAKDAALISFLQKISEQQNAGAPIPQFPIQIQVQESSQPQPQPQPRAAPVIVPVPIEQQPPPQPPPQPQPQPPQPQPPQSQTPMKNMIVAMVPVLPPAPAQTPMNNMIGAKSDNSGGGGDINMLSPSPSRWRKGEVQALINLRTTLDMKFLENGPTGPLWEEISLAMRKLGYNRNAKRCKEKWDNINRYYKKVESSEKRPNDSKSCFYFDDLDAIYRERGKMDGQTAPIMAQPEQQWPLPQHHHQQQVQQHHQSAAMESEP